MFCNSLGFGARFELFIPRTATTFGVIACQIRCCESLPPFLFSVHLSAFVCTEMHFLCLDQFAKLYVSLSVAFLPLLAVVFCLFFPVYFSVNWKGYQHSLCGYKMSTELQKYTSRLAVILYMFVLILYLPAHYINYPNSTRWLKRTHHVTASPYEISQDLWDLRLCNCSLTGLIFKLKLN